MSAPERNSRSTRRLNAVGAVLALALCFGIIVALVLDVQKRLDALARASSDSVQWALAQLEVETQRMREAFGMPEADLTEVRKRYDILYSRISIFDSGTLYSGLRASPDFNARLAEVENFLSDALPIIDGPDPVLRAALPKLHTRASELGGVVRSMSLAGIDYFAGEADRRRNEMAMTLRSVAGLAGFLIVALSILATVLLRLYRRSQEQAVENRLTRTRLETIVATSVDAIVVVDRRGIVLAFNPAAETTFGFTRDEALASQVTDLIFPPDAVGDTISAIEAQLINAKTQRAGHQRIELEAIRKDGTRFPIEISVARAANADGEILVAYIRDISNRRQAERDLTEARDQALKGERAKAEFLAVMSHEMRTPLNGLLGSVDVLGATNLSAPQREILDVIETSGQILLHHVNSVLDISSAEAPVLRPDNKPFVVEALVREVVANQHGLASANGSRIEIVAVTDPVGRVMGDPARLRQILLNLVGNAVKFTRNGKISVEIEAERADRGTRIVEFRVVDSGIGIAEEDQARIFDDFVTLDSSYGRETGGTGLGLGITRRLVQVLGGEIGMESEPGDGSVFWVRLPFGADTECDATLLDVTAAGETPKAPGLSVLVIEDNAINRFVLRALLEEANHRVAEAIDGLDGVIAAEAAEHDVILMDISMPRLDGIEAARQIRAGSGKSRDARIVAVTAHALPDELDRFRAAGIDDYLIKPVTRGTLARAVSGHGPLPPALPAIEGPAAAAVIDEHQLADLLAHLGPATAEGLLRRFIREGDEIVAALTAPQPAPDLQRLCHRLAGSAATFGALRLGAILRTMADRQHTEGALSVLRGLLSETWPATRAALAAAHPRLAHTAVQSVARNAAAISPDTRRSVPTGSRR